MEVPAEFAEFVGGMRHQRSTGSGEGFKNIEARGDPCFVEHYPVTNPLELPDLGNATERMMQALKNGDGLGFGEILTWMGRLPPPCWLQGCERWGQRYSSYPGARTRRTEFNWRR